MQRMKKPKPELSNAAKAEIIRALYDAADRVFEEQGELGSSLRGVSTASLELEDVLTRARQLGDEEFVQTVESAMNKFAEQVYRAQCNHTQKDESGD